MSFKEGDWVVCINDRCMEELITMGNRYIVAAYHSRPGAEQGPYICLKGVYFKNSGDELQNFLARRFELAPAGCNWISDELWDVPMGIRDV